jgi:hypothetical protein
MSAIMSWLGPFRQLELLMKFIFRFINWQNFVLCRIELLNSHSQVLKLFEGRQLLQGTSKDTMQFVFKERG